MKVFNILFVYFFCIKFINGGNLLFIQTMPFSSYTNLMTSIIETLAPFHNITFFSIKHDANSFNHSNVKVEKLIMPKLHIVSLDNIFVELEKDKSYYIISSSMFGLTKDFIENTFKMNKNLQNLIETKPKFDLLFVYSHLTEHLFPIAFITNASLIQLAASSPLPWQNEAIGNPNFLSTDHSLLIDENPHYFTNRLINYIKQIRLLMTYYWHYIPLIENTAKHFYPPGTPTISDVTQNTATLLVNRNKILGISTPVVPNYLEIGGIHCKPSKRVPKNVETFLKGTKKNGFIYVSFGTTIAAKYPRNFLLILLKVFSKLPQKILLKWNEDLENVPSNVFIQKWYPQQDILGHPNIKLVITQGGILSIQEAIYHGVSIFLIPISFDQPLNAYLIERLGCGKYIKFKNVSEDLLFNELTDVLQNPTYKEKMKQISRLMKDEQISPAEKLKWWTDYLIRHKGYPIYKEKNNPYTWYKHLETDILLIFLLILLVLIGLLIICVSKIKCIFGKKIKLKSN